MLLPLLVAIITTSSSAQGVAGASIRGVIVTTNDSPVAGATVTLINTGSGTTYLQTSGATGAYFFDNVGTGSHKLEVRAIGYAPATIAGMRLDVGDRVFRRIVLGIAAASILDPIVVRDVSPLRNAGAGGAAYTIPSTAVRDLPLVKRNITGLLAMSPHATGTANLIISGQHSRFNALQIDGGTNSDVYGVTVTPGSGTGAKAISLEALDELRVLVAPFDVRQGGFSGGLITAITRSGTNEFRGSLFTSLSRAALVGSDTAGARAEEFSTIQYGLSFGGPIIRDRLHFFVAADLQASRTPFVGPSATDPTTGITEATARSAQQVFQNAYGFDPGGPEAPIVTQPDASLFIKLSWHPFPNHVLEASNNYLDASNDLFDRTNRTFNNRDGWQLSNSGADIGARTNTTRVRATSAFGPFANELIASVATITNTRDSRLRVPLFLVEGDVANNYLAAGSAKSAQGTVTSQRLIEVTDNFSWNSGAHLFTAGVQSQFVHIHDNFFSGAWGTWTFSGVDELELGTPSRYEVSIPLRPGGPVADFRAEQTALHIQDQWSVNSRFTLTAGLRVDVPSFSAPVTNTALLASAALGRIDTKVFPSGNSVVSPRLGFSYEVGNTHRTMLRGGIGGFTGRPPFVWLGNAFSNTGADQTVLVCNAQSGVPAPTTDITQLPAECLNGPAATTATPTVSFFDRDFRFQQAFKIAVGVDHDFRGGMTGSLDVVRTTTRNSIVVADVNLADLGANAEGRVMYGVIPATISASNAILPTRLDAAYGSVFHYANVNGENSISITASVERRSDSGAFLHLGYNWSSTSDIMSMTGLNSLVIFQTNPIDGSIGSRKLRRSARDVPHNFVAVAATPAPLGMTVSGFLRARSGTPYAYVARGDANADGTTPNDLAYVPRDSADVSLTNSALWSTLNSFIEGEPCLRAQRGAISKRNSCRNPAVVSLDARIEKSLRIGGAQRIQISADIFNLPQLLNHNWGLVRQTTAGETLQFLSVAGWDATNNRPRYSIPSIGGNAALPTRNQVVVDASRWRVQLGARYSF